MVSPPTDNISPGKLSVKASQVLRNKRVAKRPKTASKSRANSGEIVRYRIKGSLAIILWVILVSCAYKLLVPAPPGVLYDGSVVEEMPAYELRTADYDGDGHIDVYAIRAERCGKYTTRCTGKYGATIAPRAYECSVTITRGGSNGTVILRQVIWTSDHKIEATGWVVETGDLAVKINGKWERVPWTAPKWPEVLVEKF